MKYLRLRVCATPIAMLAWCLVFGVGAAAQIGTGTLTGTVVDEQDASLPGAVVTATEQATGAVRTVPTDTDGVFRLAGLPPGRYSLQITLDGFAPVNLTEIPLAPTEVRDVGPLRLRIGQLTESVTVSGEAAAVQTRSSARVGTVTADQLTNIMQKGRDVWGLMSTVPGVQDTNMNRDFTTWTSMSGITINGMPNYSKNVVMDGVSIIDELGTNAMVNPNIDAVGEVQVISNGFTAENRQSNGGLIVMTTKSGTSEFRGSAWYNARRREWNANEYFRKKQGLPRPLYHVNIPGYSIGGPIWIPKLLDKDHLFFFASQEFTDDLRESQIERVNYPTALERRGDFSQTYVGNANGPGEGTVVPIIDPLTGQPFPGNKIPQDRINPISQAMLNLLPMPNGIHDPATNQYNASNSLYETLPRHSRTNNTLRFDVVLSQNVRGSYRFIKDREDNVLNNRFAPGIGTANNGVPGYISTGSVTAVLGPTLVNETTVGFAHNSYSWVPADDEHFEDYRQFYRSAAGVDPPRLSPFGDYRDPQGLGAHQTDEYPYLPQMAFGSDTSQRQNLAEFSPGVTSGRVLPSANRNDRWSFQNDLSWTLGRHNLKFGFYTEWTSKTEPGTPNYRGNFDFGHDPQNPLSTGNGYANALLGVFNTYTETTNRVDRDRRHWNIEGYAQDSWRVTPSFTLDYGVRFTRTGSFYDKGKSTAGFYEPDWDPAQAPRLYRPTCLTGVPGNVPCPATQRSAYDPANPDVLLPSAFIGNLVPGSGSQINGMVADGYPGRRPGEYYDFTPFVAAPRLGFAWDIRGDGKQALRASTGVFYSLPTRGWGPFDGWERYVGLPPAALERVIQWADFSDIENFATSDLSFVESPINVFYAGGETRSLEKSYNLNVAYQRDIGFNTTAEIAYVGSWSYISGRAIDINRPVNAVNSLADPSRMFNGEALDTDFLRTAYPGMGSIEKWFDVKDGLALNDNTLRYNSMQLSVQRRLSGGLQFGVAYTLAKGEGWSAFDFDPVIQEADPSGELNRIFYWGPTNNNRTHNLNINYTYVIPDATPNVPVLKWVFDDWQISGVTRFLSGAPTELTCESNNPGIANQNPTLTPGVTARCVYTGEPIFEVSRDPNLPEDEQMHFNPRAFAMAQPFNSTEGNFGNVPNGILRHPGYWSWDLTLARRFPIPGLGDDAHAQVQLQLFNVFNTAQFTEMDTTLTFQDDPNVPGLDNLLLTSTEHARYTETNPPRQFGITLRLDF